MILGAFGDSFLFGSDLQDVSSTNTISDCFPSQFTYPALLAQALEYEYHCYAFPASGNKVIADDILRAIKKHSNNMFYVINWTYFDRFDYIAHKLETEDKYNNKLQTWHHITPGMNDSVSKNYYKNFFSEQDAKFCSLVYIYSVTNALIENNCKFLMTSLDDLILDKQFHCPESIEYLQDKIVPFIQTFDGVDFLQWVKQKGFGISKTNHPLEQAHEKAAEYWLPKVRTLLNSSAKEDYLHAFI